MLAFVVRMLAVESTSSIRTFSPAAIRVRHSSHHPVPHKSHLTKLTSTMPRNRGCFWRMLDPGSSPSASATLLKFLRAALLPVQPRGSRAFWLGRRTALREKSAVRSLFGPLFSQPPHRANWVPSFKPRRNRGESRGTGYAISNPARPAEGNGFYLDAWCCEGFRMPAHRMRCLCARAGVRKPPRKEPAGSGARSMGI